MKPKKIIQSVAKLVLSALVLAALPATAKGEDRFSQLIRLISFELDQPELDIAQASVSECILKLETLRRTPDRSIVSTTTIVALADMYGNNSAFHLIPGRENEEARWSIHITGQDATATYRLDRPSRRARLSFRDRFDKKCLGETCEVNFVPDSLSVRLPSSTPTKRKSLVRTFRTAISYCYDQAD